MSKKQTIPPCPYCADPARFDQRLAPAKGDEFGGDARVLRRGSHWPEPPATKGRKKFGGGAQFARWGGGDDPRVSVLLETPEIIRGKLRIRTITGADLVERYAKFQVRVIGVESRSEPPLPSGVFFGRRLEQKAGKPLYISFDAARITHRDSPIIVDSHWHPSHGRIVTVRGFERVAATAEELGIITTALSFDTKQKRRGAPPKIDQDVLFEVIRAQGEKATQKSVAAVTGIAVGTLRDWLYFRAGTTWENLKREVAKGRHLGQ
jgi:hypothetical protein